MTGIRWTPRAHRLATWVLGPPVFLAFVTLLGAMERYLGPT